MTFNKLLAAEELLQDRLMFSDVPVEVRDDVPPHTLYILNGQEPIMRVDLSENQTWGFIEFTKHSAEYMLGSINPIWFYLRLPFAWFKFDRRQRRG